MTSHFLHLNRGRRLFTKDGRQVGNAIIIRKMRVKYKASSIFDAVEMDVYEIETDFGNRTKLTLDELLSRYYTEDFNGNPYYSHVDRWRKDQRILRERNQADDQAAQSKKEKLK